MSLPPQAWHRFFTALAATGITAQASRAAPVNPRVVYGRIAAGKGPSPTPAQAAWLARYYAAKQTALDRRRAALRRIAGLHARLAALALEGKKQGEIARELGCHRTTVNLRLLRLGLGTCHPDFSPPTPPAQPRPNRLSPQQWQRFFATLARRGIISEACRASGISFTAAHARLAAARRPGATPRDTAWLARFHAARDIAADHVVSAAPPRFRHGARAPAAPGSPPALSKRSASKGKRSAPQESHDPLAHIRTYSDGLLQVLLRAHCPEIYGNRPAPSSLPTGRIIRPALNPAA
jgi:hypothetical protein